MYRICYFLSLTIFLLLSIVPSLFLTLSFSLSLLLSLSLSITLVVDMRQADASEVPGSV